MPSKDTNLPAEYGLLFISLDLVFFFCDRYRVDGATRPLGRMGGLMGPNATNLMVSDLAPGGVIPMVRVSLLYPPTKVTSRAASNSDS